MGLNIVVGILAELDESELDTSEPDDLAGELCDDFRAIGRALAAAGEGTRVIGSEREAGSAYDHLIHHSDCEGFYVPVDFAAVFYDKEITGGWVGSSQRLLEECRGIAARLGLPEDLDPWGDEVSAAVEADTEGAEGWRRYGVESFTCLQVMAAARHSIGTGAAIVLC